MARGIFRGRNEWDLKLRWVHRRATRLRENKGKDLWEMKWEDKNHMNSKLCRITSGSIHADHYSILMLSIVHVALIEWGPRAAWEGIMQRNLCSNQTFVSTTEVQTVTYTQNGLWISTGFMHLPSVSAGRDTIRVQCLGLMLPADWLSGQQ